jgi:protein-tyrosine phosphatase
MNLVFPRSSGWRALLTLLLAPAASFSAELVQKTPPTPPPDANSPVLIWDTSHKLGNSLPRNFRTTDDPLKADKGKIPANTGLVDLHASGGGEFSAEGLKLLLKRTRGAVTVFDLRQETHIFVNGLPISWFATNDWANVDRTHSTIERDETERVESLTPASEIVITGDAVKKSGLASSAPKHVVVKRASTERDIVESNNAAYVRLTVTDHARPLDEEVDRFIQAVRALPKNSWAHFHCEAGRGRTTTFMVLYDMLRNANRVALQDIAGRQKLLGYNYDVLRPAQSGDWKAPYTDDRIAFVRAFYRYAQANPGGRPQLWSEWLNAAAH